jgi:hypothetical protein
MWVRGSLSVILVGACITGSASIFREQALQYAHPLQIPPTFVLVPIGDKAEIEKWPVFLHFFNLDCPCSRFNLGHVKALRAKMDTELPFVGVMPYFADVQAAKKQLGAQTRTINNQQGETAEACGIYATPQAVIIDAQHCLYFKGNYNKSRYCTLKETSYAAQAMEAFLQGKSVPFFDALATTSFGCSIEPPTETLTLWKP